MTCHIACAEVLLLVRKISRIPTALLASGARPLLLAIGWLGGLAMSLVWATAPFSFILLLCGGVFCFAFVVRWFLTRAIFMLPLMLLPSSARPSWPVIVFLLVLADWTDVI